MKTPPHILIAVDDTDGARCAVEHVAQTLCVVGACDVTLLHVAHIDHAETSRASGPEADPSAEEQIEVAVFAPARATLRSWSRHDHPTRVRATLVTQRLPHVAAAICREALRGQYDILVMGRPAHSAWWHRLRRHVATTVQGQLDCCDVWLVE